MASFMHVIRNQRDLHIELEPVTAKWKPFAEQLGLPEYTIRTIAASGGSNPEECITEVLTRWAQQMTQSWGTLIDAIKSTNTNVNLVEQLRDKYRSELSGNMYVLVNKYRVCICLAVIQYFLALFIWR